MPAVTACLACRSLKARCLRGDVSESCLRCGRLGIDCETIPRRLGRRLGSKNRPKSSSGPPGDPSISPTSSRRSQQLEQDSHRPRRSPSPPQSRPRIVEPSRGYDDTLGLHDPVSRHHTPLPPPGPNGPPYSNMLNVLAKVADEMPPNHQTVATSPDTPAYPFDRRKFLGMYRQASRSLDPDPYMGMAVLEQGLDQLFDMDETATKIHPGEEIVYSRVDQPRRDVLPEWDVLTTSLLSENEVDELLEVYWTRCHSILRLLDPAIYTLQHMRNTSCLLLTTVLQVSAQSLPVSRHSSSLVSRLDNHLDHLFAEIVRQGLQSLEICQGLMMFATWMRADKQHQTWQFIAQVIGMALELRLDVNATPTWHATEAVYTHLSPIVKRRNIQRFWLLLADWDRRLAFIRGRRQLLRDTMLISRASLRSWWTEPDALDCDVMTCATVGLRIPVTTVQQNIQRAMATHETLSFEDHLANVDAEMEAWRAEWYTRLGKDDQQRSEHDLRSARLVLLMTPYDSKLGSESMPHFARDECLIAALDVCKNAIPLLGGVQPGLPVQNVTAARLYLLGYTSLCALRIMGIATPNDDRPNIDVELFHLSILSALATKLCGLNVHRNVSLIASVLGRRLLYACRKVAAKTMARGTAITDYHPDPDEPNGLPVINSAGATLAPGDLDFSFDFSLFPLNDLFPLFDNELPMYPQPSL
ncbi:hypothetical protein IAU60_004110 [Kwoniella sp. DSM 27419]